MPRVARVVSSPVFSSDALSAPTVGPGPRALLRVGAVRTGLRAAEGRARPEPRHPLDQPGPQLGLDRRAGAVRGQFGEPGDQPPADGDRGEQPERCGQVAEIEVVPEGTHHDLGDQHGLADDQARSGKPEHHHRDKEDAGGAGVSEEPGSTGFT